MIRIGAMVVDGFASIQHLEMDWDGSYGVVLVSARNGSGKSRLINALYWVLFGKSLYGSVETWDHLKPKDYKGVKVELDLVIDEVPYHIIRCLNYTGKVGGFSGKSRFIVIENDKPWDIKDKRDIQMEWQKILKYTPELFTNSIIFGQKQRRLMDNRSTEKKALFDEAFDTMILSKAYSTASDEVKEELANLLRLRTDYRHLEDKVSLYKKEKERQKEVEKKFYQDIKAQIEILESEIYNLKNSEDNSIKEKVKGISNDLYRIDHKLSKEKDLLSEEALVSTDRAKVDGLIRANQQSIFVINKELRELNSRLKKVTTTTVCPTCGKDYSKEEIKAEAGKIERAINTKEDLLCQYSEDLTKNNRKLKAYDEKLEKIQEKLDKITQLKHEKVRLESTLDSLKEKIKINVSINERIERLESNIAFLKSRKYDGHDYDSDIEKINRKAKEKKRLIMKSRIAVRRLKFSQELFSNKGIKSWLFSFLLEKVNEKLKDYAAVSGFEINFWVDLESVKGDIYTLIKFYGEEVPYEDLSGGQQQLVNLISIFAVMDVIQEKRYCPLFIGDELFESLDRENVHIVGNIIREKSRDKKIFIVTHLEDFILENATVIKLSNVNGQTVLS